MSSRPNVLDTCCGVDVSQACSYGLAAIRTTGAMEAKTHVTTGEMEASAFGCSTNREIHVPRSPVMKPAHHRMVNASAVATRPPRLSSLDSAIALTGQRHAESRRNTIAIQGAYEAESFGEEKVHPEGFEPPTPGSEDRCSILLSYGCRSPSRCMRREATSAGGVCGTLWRFSSAMIEVTDHAGKTTYSKG